MELDTRSCETLFFAENLPGSLNYKMHHPSLLVGNYWSRGICTIQCDVVHTLTTKPQHVHVIKRYSMFDN